LDQAPEAQAGAEPEPTGDPKDGGLPVEPKPPVENADASSTEAGEPEAKERKLLELPAVKRSLEHGQEWLIANTPSFIGGTVTIATGILSLLFLSTLFSYLIVLDLDGLRREVTKLTETKLNQFYKETGSNIAKFGEVLGKVLEAQAMIACANALLTGIGLWLFGLEHVIFLSLIVFVCGFVPVAGVFLSSAPICLLGLYQGGPGMMVLLIAFIIGIHFVEAYFLNPRIMGAALKVNPVLTLVILVVGHHAMGVWGMLLGLPLCYYFFTHVIKKEDRDIGLWVRLET
ncbi:MAG: AI-2E family transporter, partial [Planctomycetota bacterium]